MSGIDVRSTVPATSTLCSPEEAIDTIARGGMVVVVDSPDRENEGDLVMAAERASAASVNFMARHGRGLVCVPMRPERLADLGIQPMVARNTDVHSTAFHVSVDHATSTTTGISASDRAATIRALADPGSTPRDFRQPGHVFPLAYRDGGVLRRAGHTEAAVDLATMASLEPAGLICEISADDGEMAQLPALLEFGERYDLPVLAITDLIAYRRHTERLVRAVHSAKMPIGDATFTALGYRELHSDVEHVALVLGEVRRDGVLVRVHSECLTGDVFGSRRCDCGEQLQLALDRIAAEGSGVLVYLRGHEGRGIGLLEKLRAYQLQDAGLDTVEANLALGHPADRRDYGIGMQILADLGVGAMRLMTNNPSKRAGLEGYGLSIVERVPLIAREDPKRERYLATKRAKLGHLLD